jgi:hypothetical protein
MFSGFFKELKSQMISVAQVVQTREFWIYLGVLVVLLLIAAGGIRLATSFDPMTRGMLRMSFSCNTGEGQLATIIIGSFVFLAASVVTLGEVINWVEETKISQAPGRHPYKISYWRPILHVIGTMALGGGGYSLMLTWCT